MGSSNSVLSSLMMFTTWLRPSFSIFLWKITLQDGKKEILRKDAISIIQDTKQVSLFFHSDHVQQNLVNGVQLALIVLSERPWYHLWLDIDVSWGKNSICVDNTCKEVDVEKTIARHLSASALHLREVFRIRSRKVMISETRLDVIHQRMGNCRSKSRCSVSTERVR